MFGFTNKTVIQYGLAGAKLFSNCVGSWCDGCLK